MSGSSKRQGKALREFLESEASGGLILMAAAAAALAVANSALAPAYFGALEAKLGPLSLLHWINDALMALFFLLVGLEIKRELIGGELSTWRKRLLPGIAAASGMAVPAMVFVAFNRGDPEMLRGWAIPAATDIAFALGVLALLGPRVPASLKLFLTTVAIVDDLGAVLIIALFYTADLALTWLGFGATILLALFALNRAGVTRLWPYLLLGIVLWVCFLRSGVHATVAGVALAMALPLRAEPGPSPLHRLEHAINPWIAFLVVPIFGFANAGVSLSGLGWAALAAPLPLGIAAGLFLGKQAGVFAAVWAATRLRLAEPPAGASVGQIYGVALLCGVGFTMSLFIGLLAFPDAPLLQAEVKIGVLLGSIMSAITGAAVLARYPARKANADETHPPSQGR